MKEYGGMEPTGRELREPAATLVEVSDEDAICTAIRFDEVYRGHPALTVGVELIESFLTYPMVIGLAEMRSCDTEQATFVFETGPIWTLTEILRRHRDIGQACGARAAFEMAWLAAQILEEAGETGPREGCYSHGNLTPWRIAIRPDGSVQIFGYGLPPVEWICHRDDPDYVIDADSVRYAPPERLELDAEDPAADTYALMLCVWEMITGEPLMEGHDVETLKKQISLSEAQKKVSKAKIKGVPKQALDLIARALIFDPDTRLSGQQLLDALAEILDGKLPGDSLADVIKRIRGKARSTPKGRKITSMEGTGMFTPDQLADMADEDEDDEEEEEEKRWSKARRRKKADDGDEEEKEDAPKRRRRRKKASDEDEDGDEDKPTRRRRRRKKAEDEDEEASSEDKPTRRRRRRKTEDDDAGDDEESASGEDSDEDSDEDEAPRRRRRRRTTPDEDDAEDEKAKKADSKKDEAKKDEARKDDTKKADPKKDEAKKADPKKDDGEEEKPRRRRRRRTEDADEEDPSESDSEDDGSEEEAEDKPSRRRRRRTSSSDGDEDPDASSDKDEDDAEEASPRRRRRRRTSSDDDAKDKDEDEDDSSEDEDKAEDKPRRRRRRRKTDEDEDAKPKRRRRRKKKKDE